jgi:hypothetical protein
MSRNRIYPKIHLNTTQTKGIDFSSLPEGTSEIVIKGKRYEKVTKTITEWVEKK